MDHETVIPSERTPRPLPYEEPGARVEESSCVYFVASLSAEEPRTLTHPWLGDKPGSADSRFLGRRQDAVQNAGIDAAPPSE